MTTNVGYATLTVIPSAKGFSKGLNGQVVPAVGKTGNMAGAALGGGMLAAFRPLLGGLAVGAAGAAIGGFLVDATGKASDLGETTAKASQIFGAEALPALQNFARGADRALGQSEQAALDASTTFGVFGKSAGLSGGALVDFSTDMTTLAGDLASFGNATPQEAIDALGAALRGEAEPMRRFGVLLDDATLRNRAMALGITDTTTKALTPQQKVLAAQAEILAQTADAQGDFQRTSGGLANQQRILSAQWENSKQALGQAFLPLATSAVSLLNQGLTPAVGLITGAVSTFSTTAGPAMSTVKDAVSGLFDLFVNGNYNANLRTALGLEEDSGIVASVLAIRDGVVTAFGELSAFIQTQVVPRVSLIWSAFQTLVDTVVPIAASFVAGMLARIRPLMPTISAIFRSIGQVVTGAMDLIKAIIQRVTSFISTLWNDWGSRLMNTATVIFSSVLNIIRPAVETMKSVIKLALSIIKGDWSGAWDAVKSVLSNAWLTIKNTVRGSIAVVESVLQLALDAIWATMKSVWGKVVSVVSTAMRDMGAAVDRGIDTAVDWVKGLPGRAISALSGIGSKLVSAGSDLIGGFIRGITNRAGGIVTAIRNSITDKIPAFVKSALGIRSPSRVFMALGEHTANGMAIGIANGAKAVQRAADGLIPSGDYSLSAGVTAAGGVMGGAAGELSITVEISPKDLDGLRSIEDFVNMARQRSRQTLGVV